MARLAASAATSCPPERHPPARRFPDRIVQANAPDDEAAMTATAEPGLGGSDLIAVSESPPLAHGNTILVSYGNVPHAPH